MSAVLLGCGSHAATSAPGAPAPQAAARQPDQAPDVYRARISTSKGPVEIEVHRSWAPLAADRFHELVRSGYYSDARFYRVVPGFVVQFGMAADPDVYAAWQTRPLKDEPARRSNTRGAVCFTGSAASDSRTTHVFINLADNPFLDTSSAPFGQVISGMQVVDSLYAGYGEHAPMGTGPEQQRLWREGNRYLAAEFPNLDYILQIVLE
jgi:peptidyl-prolyl cis-trans isomerase A (cyclophilin A)